MSTRRLLSLVSQLLDLGKLKTGKLQLDLDPTDVASLVQGAVDEVRPWAEDRGLRLTVVVSDSIPKLLVDAKRIHQVLVNLLANAVKFSRAGGVITLTAEVTGQELVMKVSDTGIGIPAHLQATVFERYEQAHGQREGTGLGLAIVKGFVLAHGGRVWVESEEGRGSSLWARAPPGGAPVRRLALLLVLLALSACSAAPWSRLTSSFEADRLVRDAEAQLQAGNPSGAVRILEDVVRRYPDAPVHDEALYVLARALVLGANGAREYRQAAAHLDRLLREHPTSRYAADARAWRAMLGVIVARGAELDRLLERLKAIDIEHERPRQP